MSGKRYDSFFMNKKICEDYVKEVDKARKNLAKDESIISDILSCYYPKEDKVHVALGVGGGMDFSLAKHKSIKRKIGLDYSPHMLTLCGRKYQDVELIQDDFTTLENFKQEIEKENRSVFYTLLTNTIGNLNEDDRKKSIKAIRGCMKSGDLLILELYRRIEELRGMPESLKKIKFNLLYEDKLFKILSPEIPKKASLGDYLKAFGLPDAYLHSFAQQNDYSELKLFSSVKHIYSEYDSDKHNLVVCEIPNPGDFKNKKPFFISHRWSYNEIKNNFTSSEMEIDIFPQEKMYVCTAWRI